MYFGIFIPLPTFFLSNFTLKYKYQENLQQDILLYEEYTNE